MGVTKNKEVFIDFTKEPGCPVFAKASNAIATAADNQENYCWVGGTKYIEWIQTGAWTALMPNIAAAAPFGWEFDLDATNGDGLEMTMGMAASASAGALSFVVGTDPAFFVRMKGVVTTLGNSDVVGVGFRELGAYTDITDPATMGSVYDNKYAISVDDAIGAIVSHSSVAASDVQTAATGTPIVTAQAFEFLVTVSAAGVCQGYIALDSASSPLPRPHLATADVLLEAAAASARTLPTGTVVVPYITQVGTGTASDFVLQEWEVGYVRS